MQPGECRLWQELHRLASWLGSVCCLLCKSWDGFSKWEQCSIAWWNELRKGQDELTLHWFSWRRSNIGNWVSMYRNQWREISTRKMMNAYRNFWCNATILFFFIFIYSVWPFFHNYNIFLLHQWFIMIIPMRIFYLEASRKMMNGKWNNYLVF